MLLHRLGTKSSVTINGALRSAVGHFPRCEIDFNFPTYGAV